jgi:ABC-type multidrug transport system ATPase subunit
MEDAPIAIQISNLSKRYPGQPADTFALKDVSLEVPVGKIVCLLGPNGSGKTTLLKIISGLVHPTSGSLSIMGHDMSKDPDAARGQIGWMPAEERSTFYGRMTGRQNLDFFAALHQVSQAELDRIVGNLALQIGLGDELDVMMLKTSGGARQKVAVARALLHNPSVLVLDEPLRNLDPHTLKRFRRLLKDHLTRIQKKAVILSTHQLEEARRVADIIVIIKNGTIIHTVGGRDIDKELQDTTVEDFYLKTIDAAPVE